MVEIDNEKRRKRMEQIDALSPEVRAIVHEEGWTIVDAFMRAGVTRAKIIRHLIMTVRSGSYNGAFNPSSPRTPHHRQSSEGE